MTTLTGTARLVGDGTADAVSTPHRIWARAQGAVRAVAGAFTPLGATISFCGIAAWFLGWQLGWEEFMLAAATCLLLVAIALAFTFGRMDVDVAVAMAPQRVVVGETAHGQVSTRNTGQRRMLGLRLELTVGSGVAEFDIPTLGAAESHDDLFVIPTRKRAVVPVGPARTLRGDPVGLLRRTLAWPGMTTLYVHPLTVALDGVGAGFLRDLEGRTTDATSTSDVELHTLRDYVPGDDRRYVHWRTSARSGRLMVRQFVDTRRSHVAIVMSGLSGEYANDDEFELAVSALASLGVRAVRDQQSLTVLAAGRLIGTSSPVTVLDGASGINASGGTGLVDSAARMVRRNGDTTLAVLITGSETPLPVVRAAAGRFGPDVKVVVVTAALGGTSGVRDSGALLMLNLGALGDLPRLIRAVAS